MINQFKLWIDDQSFDTATPERHCPEGFKAAISSQEAIDLVLQFGVPSFIDFDHDLGLLENGEPDSVRTFLKWLSDNYYEDGLNIQYRVHSANPSGKEYIISYMESWKKSLR